MDNNDYEYKDVLYVLFVICLVIAIYALAGTLEMAWADPATFK